MTAPRGTAVAIALLLAALAAAGCGLGPGAGVGTVRLTVTRDYGREPVLRRSLDANESDTVMRLLEGSADVQTRYGGGYVHSIDGLAEAQRGGDPYDWFFYVDGSESAVGAADVQAKGGERIWWDYRDWAATNHVPAVVGSWPAPFADGVEGGREPVALECAGALRGSLVLYGRTKEPQVPWGGACAAARAALEGAGARLASGSPKGAIRVLVGPWDRLREDPAARLVEQGPAESGVYADFRAAAGPPSPRRADSSSPGQGRAGGSYELVALDEGGGEARRLGPGAGLVAATSHYGGPPVWLVTGGTAAAVRSAARLLEAADLRDRYAVASEGGKATPLPLEGR